jgi:hypothetical protein
MTAPICGGRAPAGAVLVPVTGPAVYLRCAACHRMLLHDPGSNAPSVYADVNGPAFRAYYCAAAAARAGARS